MTAWQVLTRIELPLATPLIFAGIRTGSVYVIATATLATFAGGGGLGDIIVNESTYGVPGVIAGSLAIIALAFLVDGLLALVQREATPRPLRKSGRLGRADAVVTAAGPATEDLVVQQS
jgi:osmoprotectant transport system permease protein